MDGMPPKPESEDMMAIWPVRRAFMRSTAGRMVLNTPSTLMLNSVRVAAMMSFCVPVVCSLTPALAMTRSISCSSSCSLMKLARPSWSVTSPMCVTTVAPLAVHSSAMPARRSLLRPVSSRVTSLVWEYSRARPSPMPEVAPVMRMHFGFSLRGARPLRPQNSDPSRYRGAMMRLSTAWRTNCRVLRNTVGRSTARRNENARPPATAWPLVV
mmetsp:Transcript_10259/g.24520  ORF Transcript_10259/g.24520 Transcript_10259/m.24520 type:complete len:212 (+) Transcript_10259:435-1070(+)